MPDHRPRLKDAIAALRRQYGSPEGPPTSDPFELILWENVAYLATPERRREAFAELGRAVGLSPAAILASGNEALERVASRGILEKATAEKQRAAAAIAVDRFGGDLETAVRGPVDEAKRALRAFPSIGEPGAEKILLFAGRAGFLAPESNGLRVLARLGYLREESSYARTYAAARPLAAEISDRPKILQEAHLLLQLHGRTLCKRARPMCEACPLATVCAYALASVKAAPSGPGARRRKPTGATRRRP